MPFLKIGPSDSIPGKGYRRAGVLGRSFAVFRRPDGSLAACDLTCRHQNGDLTRGERDGDVVTCPRHGWSYDLRTGACLNEPWARLRGVAAYEADGAVYVATAPDDEIAFEPAPEPAAG